MRHRAGDDSQAIIEYSLVVHYWEFYFAFCSLVNADLTSCHMLKGFMSGHNLKDVMEMKD